MDIMNIEKKIVHNCLLWTVDISSTFVADIDHESGSQNYVGRSFLWNIITAELGTRKPRLIARLFDQIAEKMTACSCVVDRVHGTVNILGLFFILFFFLIQEARP